MRTIRFQIMVLCLGFLVGNLEAADSKPAPAKTELATFAGGCFWCVVKPFHKYKGVNSVYSGYTGGTVKNPTYEQVSTGTTGHYEAVQVEFDPSIANYKDLLDGFWRVIDPTDGDGQFADRGSQYKPAIFYHSAAQKKIAEESKQALEQMPKFKGKRIQVAILPAQDFYRAEDHHQDFFQKNSAYYERYYEGSGRKAYIERVWGKEKQ